MDYEDDGDDLFIEEFLNLDFTVNAEGEVLHIAPHMPPPEVWRFFDVVEEGLIPTSG